MGSKDRREVWHRVNARMERAASYDRARVLREEMIGEGITEVEAVCRVVEVFLGKTPTEDQLKALAATFASAFGMKPDRFVALWLRERSKR